MHSALHIIVLLTVAALVAWKGATVGLGRLLMKSDAALAVAIDPGNSRAALALARQALTQTPQQRERARTLLRQLLHSRPVDGRLFRALGQLAGEDRAMTGRFMRAALVLGPADIEAHRWMVGEAVSRDDFRRAVTHVDAILRVAPQHAKQLFPILEQWIEDGSRLDAFVATLASGPPWRRSFIEFVARSTSTRALYPLVRAIQAMRQSPTPVALGEATVVINRLVQAHDPERAYLLWRSLLPPQQGVSNILYNGDFGTTASGAAFDWTVRNTTGATVQIDSDGELHARSLRVRFDDRPVSEIGVVQILLLQPGDYRLIGDTRLESVHSARGLEWQIHCIGESQQLIGAGPLLEGTRNWSSFELDFRVPDRLCLAQRLRLAARARVSTGHVANGVAWFDNLHIEARNPRP